MNRKISYVIMAVLIAASVLVGGMRGIVPLKNAVDTAFVSGVEQDGLSIQGDLTAVLEQSHNLTTIAKNVFGEADARIQAVSDARIRLQSASTPSEKFTAYTALYEAVSTLYFAVRDSLGEEDSQMKLCKQYYAEICSRADTIRLDGYNKLASDYNQTISGFPTALIAGLLGCGQAELFS